MSRHFWLLCGLWCGLGNAFYMRTSLRRHVAAGTFTQSEVDGFVKGLALWILVPCLLLWGLQLSASESTPDFLAWPSPQRHVAFVLQLVVWGALLFWVFRREGADTLSVYYGATSRGPKFLCSPWAIRLGAVAVVAAGVIALLSRHA